MSFDATCTCPRCHKVWYECATGDETFTCPQCSYQNIESEEIDSCCLNMDEEEELAEFGKHYADKVEVDKICFQIKNFEFDDTEEKNILVCEYFKNGEFTIEDDEIFSYECYESPAFMPVYNRHKIWACLDREFDEEVFNKNIAIFKRYVQLTIEGKMFFGVQISKIESVTLELC